MDADKLSNKNPQFTSRKPVVIQGPKVINIKGVPELRLKNSFAANKKTKNIFKVVTCILPNRPKYLPKKLINKKL